MFLDFISDIGAETGRIFLFWKCLIQFICIIAFCKCGFYYFLCVVFHLFKYHFRLDILIQSIKIEHQILIMLVIWVLIQHIFYTFFVIFVVIKRKLHERCELVNIIVSIVDLMGQSNILIYSIPVMIYGISFERIIVTRQ